MRRGVLLALMLLAACKGVVVTAFPESFVGVGLELTIRDNIPTIVRALEGGSAQEAGLQSDDRLIEIDGEPVSTVGLPELVLRLRGENGSTVRVTVLRGDHNVIATLVRHPISRRGDDYVARTQ